MKLSISSSSSLATGVGTTLTKIPTVSRDLALRKRQRRAVWFQFFCQAATYTALAVLFLLLGSVVIEGWTWLDWQFLDSFPSRFPERAGIKSALWGSIWLLVLTTLISVPLEVGSAIYLEELMRPSRLKKIIDLNLANLAGVPSIVYGILGLALFVRALGFERSVLAGACTLTILSLPVIIIASREALRAIPRSLREAAYALGATPWLAVWHHVLPAALPGILTGIILSISRAIGETAPLIMIGALSFVAFVPEGPLDSFTALPIQIYNWAARPQAEFHGLAAAAIVVLLLLLLGANAGAIYLRNRFQRNSKWQLM